MATGNKLLSFDNNRVPRGEDKISNYAYFLGGTDVTNNALHQYDLMRSGYGRIFITQMPQYVEELLPTASDKVIGTPFSSYFTQAAPKEFPF